MSDDKINIELSKEGAIVLFEFLRRFNQNSDLDKIEDQSEQRVLWDIECVLEKELTNPFRSDYKEIVEKAREKVRDKKE